MMTKKHRSIVLISLVTVCAWMTVQAGCSVQKAAGTNVECTSTAPAPTCVPKTQMALILQKVSTPAPQKTYPTLDKDIIIPFREPQRGLIALQATFDGIKQECLWDTGSPSTLLPRSMDLHQHSFGFHLPATWDAARTPYRSELVIVPDIHVGSYTLSDMPAYTITSGPSSVTSRMDGPASRYILRSVPVLGNPFFGTSAVTIDREHHQLIVHARYDAAVRHKEAPSSILLNFTYKGYIVLDGVIQEVPAKIIFDMGNVSGALAVSRSFQRKHLPHWKGRKIIYDGALNSADGESVPGVIWMVGNTVTQSQALIVAEAGEDASIGPSIFSNYRVTIDYPHRKILLEPTNSARNTVASPLPKQHSAKHPRLRWVQKPDHSWSEMPNRQPYPPLHWKIHSNGLFEEVGD